VWGRWVGWGTQSGWDTCPGVISPTTGPEDEASTRAMNARNARNPCTAAADAAQGCVTRGVDATIIVFYSSILG
jgi:hypothetical protein